MVNTDTVVEIETVVETDIMEEIDTIVEQSCQMRNSMGVPKTNHCFYQNK